MSFLASGAVLAGHGTLEKGSVEDASGIARNRPLRLQSAPRLPAEVLWFLLSYQDVASNLIFSLSGRGTDAAMVPSTWDGLNPLNHMPK